MPILLEIPAQKATENKTRIAFLVDCAKNGDIKLEATDHLLPRVFFLSIEDLFPWKSFFEKLKIAWFRSQKNDIPFAFQFQKRISDDILKDMEKIDENDLPKVFAQLRKNGYFKPLPNRVKL